MLKIKLHWQILIAFVIAIALKMIIVPLVFSSIVSGVANLGSTSSLGRLGIKTITYYISTSVFAILTGLLLVDL